MTATAAAHPRRPAARRRAFSFVEVLFAVIILGIGFILVAAIFPVGIQQTRLTVEEASAGRTVGVAAGNFIALSSSLNKVAANDSDATTPPAVPAPVYKSWYYGWPMSLDRPADPRLATPPMAYLPVYPGPVLSFRDSRWADFFYSPVLPALTVAPARFGLITTTPLNPAKTSTVGLWAMVCGEVIVAAEPQYAYVPLFQRGYTRTLAGAIVGAAAPLPDGIVADHQVNIIAFQLTARNRSVYTYDDPAALNGRMDQPFGDLLRHKPPSATDDRSNTAPQYTNSTSNLLPANLEPRLLSGVQFTHRGGTALTDTVLVPHDSTYFYQAVGEGGFLVVSDDKSARPAAPGVFNGRVYRIGTLQSTSAAGDVWDLQPGYDTADADADIAALPVDVFIVGRALREPSKLFDPTNNPYDGPVQDVGVQKFSITAP